MTTTYLSPILNDAQFNDDGTFLVGGLIWFYEAGTTTPETAYTTNTNSTPWPNPIVLDSRGETGGEIWLDPTISYKMVLEAVPLAGATHGVVMSTFDNIEGINLPQTSSIPSDWALFPGTPTRLTNTSFSVPGDHRDIFQFNRRTQTINSAGTIYSTVKAATYSLGVTNVTVVNDTGVLDAGLNIVYYGVVETNPSSIPRAVLLGSSTTSTTDNIYISQSAGRLQQAVNTASPSSNWPIDVTGNLTGNVVGNVTGNLTGNVTGNVTGNLTGNVYALDGTVALPSISFSTDSPHSTGIYKISSGNIGFASGGVKVFSISNTGAAAIDGTTAAPSINFISESGLGLYRDSTHTMAFASNSINSLLFNEKGIQAIDGTEAHPSISFISDPTTGFSSDGASDIIVSLAGTKVAVFSHLYNSFLPLAGTAAHPSIAFVGDSSTGFSNNGSGTIRVSSTGTQVAEFGSSGMSSIPSVGGALSHVATMSQFVSSIASPGYTYLPGGILVQWGIANRTGLTGTSNAGTGAGSYPIAFPTGLFAIVGSAISISPGPSQKASIQLSGNTLSTFNINLAYDTGTTAVALYWIAIGN